MQRVAVYPKFFSLADLMILLLIGTAIYGLVAIGSEWRADFHPVTDISLSLRALPYYTLLSGIRGLVAYLISLAFTLVVGYLAAKNASAEKIIIPLLDILQSIPVLGFLPGLVLGLIAIFPRTNTGLELAAIIMIFTGQVWNMTFSYYSSLKSVPTDFNEASTVMGLSWREKLLRVELPFSAVNLAWNSLLSMAGGWFFLSVCEAFSLGDRDYRLPGIGAYMAVAVKSGDTRAMAFAIGAMILLIVGMDTVIWRPVLSWVQRFRLEEVPGVAPAEPLMKVVLRESRILRWIKIWWRRFQFRNRERLQSETTTAPMTPDLLEREAELQRKRRRKLSPQAQKALGWVGLGGTVALIAWGSWRLFHVLAEVGWPTWMVIIRNTFWTFLRVVVAIALSSIWAVPAGIWIGTSSRRIRVAQPIIQVMASFPAPMLYPIAIAVFLALGIDFSWGSMLLMLLGVQWYVLFNVLAGALRIPRELGYALELMEASTWDRWKSLYLPSVFPALVTGWITAAGGAWNASIVSEYLSYKGAILKTAGLGATISAAAANADFHLLAASLTVMVVVVVLLNRSFWARIYRLAQTRYRMDA